MNRNTLFTRGFTLIELLVVIAIIGILAAVVIGSLNDARSGGQDASIKQSVANIRSQAELIYNKNGYSYLAVCAEPAVASLINAALRVVNGTPYLAGTHGALNYAGASNGAAALNRLSTCHSTDIAYAALSPLATNNSGFWCVDSTGYSGSSTLLTASDVTCNP